MANKTDYKHLLSRPEWKVRRLQIIERDNGKCTKCGSEDNLHVHHVSYSTSVPWESPSSELITLCRRCHRLEHKKKFVSRLETDAFYITFLKALGAITDLGSSTDRAVLDVLCTIAEFDTGVVFLPAFVKDEICTTLGIKKQTLSNSLTALRKKGIISMDRGRCLINPNLFWKGAIDKRESLLRDTNISLTFSIER